MSRLLRRASVRHLQQHVGQLGFSVLGVALGVAVMVSIDLAIQSAKAGFRVSAETVAGRTTHQIVGGALGLPDDVFRAVRLDVGVRESAPVVEGYASSPRLSGVALHIVGIDPFSDGAVRPWFGGGVQMGPGVGGGFRSVTMAASLAERMGVEPGDSVPLVVEGREVAVLLSSTIQGEEEDLVGLRNLLFMDLSLTQELFGRVGSIDRIDLRLPEDGSEEEIVSAIEAVIPRDARVQTAGTRTALLTDMIGAFDLNLRALSLLALVFGMFLIYNAQTFAVVQRRELLGSLRSLGVTRREVLLGVLRESVWIGLAGAALGVGLGIVLGRGLVHLVTRTISSLYFTVAVDSLSLPPLVLLKGATFGLVATVLASLLPATEAASVPPRVAQTRSYLERGVRDKVGRVGWFGVMLILAGGAVLAIPTRSPFVGFVALSLLVFGMASLTPIGTIWLVSLLRPAMTGVFGVMGSMAARGVVTSLSRTAPAIAALVVAVSVTVGLGVMIQSFRGTLVQWLDTTLQADIFAAVPAGREARIGGVFPGDVAERFREHPSVEGLSTYRMLQVPYGDRLVRTLAVDLHARGEPSFSFAQGDGPTAFPLFRSGDGVLVSEPFAFRFEVTIGDVLSVPTPQGPAEFSVAGVYYDYGDEGGTIMMARSRYETLFADAAINSLGVFLKAGKDPLGTLAELEELSAGPQAVQLQTNGLLRQRALGVFDQTFQITAVLRFLAFVVAFVGILSALMALQLERARELGVLRATGMTPGQVRGVVLTQTGLMGLVSGIMSLPVGLVLAVVMVLVVNRRSFGWTLQMDLGGSVLPAAILLAVVGALIAGVLPAWRMGRTKPSEALRGEVN